MRKGIKNLGGGGGGFNLEIILTSKVAIVTCFK
jgi:hypothetical protein